MSMLTLELQAIRNSDSFYLCMSVSVGNSITFDFQTIPPQYIAVTTTETDMEIWARERETANLYYVMSTLRNTHR